MKILIVSYLFPNKIEPTRGIFVAERIRFLKKYCEIKVVAPIPYFLNMPIFKKWNKYSKIPKFEIRDGIEVYHPRFLLFPKNILRNHIGKLLFFSTYGLMKRIHLEWRFDIIHAHFMHPSGIAAALIGKKMNIPSLITEHYGRLDIDLDNNGMKNNIIRTINYISQMIVVSERLKNNFVKKGFAENKIQIIPNGVDTKKFSIISTNKSFKQIKLMSIGHLIESKGYQYLIKAIKILRDNKINVKLQIIGEGEYRASLEKIIHDLNLTDNVYLLGNILHSKIYRYMDNAHLFIHPSLKESFSVVTIEALACGLPVIVTRCGGPENFINEQVGYIVEKGNSLELARAIEKMIDNYSNYDSKSIREYCMENFDYNIIVKKVVNIYKKIIDETN